MGLTRQMAVIYSDRGVTTNCLVGVPTNLANTTSIVGGACPIPGRGIGITDELIAQNCRPAFEVMCMTSLLRLVTSV